MMDAIISIPDRIYPVLSLEERTRKTARGILVNDKNEIALIHIITTDAFGPRDHYETPGGGVEEGEDFITALRREMKEETGYTIKDIKEVGTGSIEYHLLKRWDEGHFYVCHTDSEGDKHLVGYEKTWFRDTAWVPVHDIRRFYAEHPAKTVGGMIHLRDLAMIEYAITVGILEE